MLWLSTAFGGGKTHTLMALWHLAQNIGKPPLGTELLPAAGRPKQVTVAPVDCGKAGVPEFARHTGVCPAENCPNDLAELLGRMGIAEERGRVAIDLGGISGDQITKISGENRILKIALQHLAAKLTTF